MRKFDEEIPRDDTEYRQCFLRNGNRFQTTWLPDKFAVLGKVLKLKDLGVWENGWIVDRVGAELVPGARLPDAHKWHKRICGK